jgi:hypothetical protein
MTNHIYRIKNLEKNKVYYAIVISMLVMMILSYLYYLFVSFKWIPNIPLPGRAGNQIDPALDGDYFINNIQVLRRVINSC